LGQKNKRKHKKKIRNRGQLGIILGEIASLDSILGVLACFWGTKKINSEET